MEGLIDHQWEGHPFGRGGGLPGRPPPSGARSSGDQGSSWAGLVSSGDTRPGGDRLCAGVPGTCVFGYDGGL